MNWHDTPKWWPYYARDIESSKQPGCGHRGPCVYCVRERMGPQATASMLVDWTVSFIDGDSRDRIGVALSLALSEACR